MLTENEIKDWIYPVQDPEMFVSIVGLGLVYKCEFIEPNKALIEMTLTSPGCPAGEQIVQEMKARLLEHENIKEADVKIVWEPKWDPNVMATEDVKEVLGIW